MPPNKRHQSEIPRQSKEAQPRPEFAPGDAVYYSKQHTSIAEIIGVNVATSEAVWYLLLVVDTVGAPHIIELPETFLTKV